MNQSQKLRTIGHVVEVLEAMALQAVGGLGDKDEAERMELWGRAESLLKARDSVIWAVRQVDEYMRSGS